MVPLPLLLATTTATDPGSGLVKSFIARPLWGSINLLITTYGILSPSHVVFDLPFLAPGADRLQPAPIALFLREIFLSSPSHTPWILPLHSHSLDWQ